MSSFSSLEMTNTNLNDSKHYNMKQFINAARDYIQTRTEDTAILINRHLQLLSVTIDLSTFDPHTNIVAEFFVTLHELLSSIEQRPAFAWCCVSVLTVACRNSAARHVLIHTYQFLPLLSRLLSDQLTIEKKIRLLSLMQELTCGIKISWQIPYLLHLMSTLTKWVDSGEEEIVTLALGVLVNLCYKNLSAVYTLSRCVDIKKFVRTCMPLKGLKTEVHVCKLLIILDYMNGKVPQDVFLKLIEVTFKSLIEAFKARDSVLLRHVVEFFLDMWEQNSYTEELLNFNSYDNDIEILLKEIENSSEGGSGDIAAEHESECIALVFKFLHFMIEMRQPKLLQLHPRLINVALKWIRTDLVCTQALAILRTITMNNTPQEQCKLLEPFLISLPIFLLAIENGDEEIPTHIENNNRLTALMELFRALMKIESTRNRILAIVKEEFVIKIFTPLLGDKSPSTRASNANTFSSEAIILYVNAIALVYEFLKFNDDWVPFYTNLMQQKQIHMVLAQALYSSPKETKILIMSISSGQFFPIVEVSTTMCELHSSTQPDSRWLNNSNQHMVDNLCFPMMSVSQIERLDEVMNKLKEAHEQNNVINVSTSDVMELYEYKLATMGHAERAAIASAEAASQRCTHLQHRTAQLTAELSRLRQLHLHAEQCHEDAVKTRNALLAKNKQLQEWLETEKTRYTNQLSIKEKLLNEKTQLLEDTTKRLKEVDGAKNTLEEKYNDLKLVVNRLEENILKKEKLIEKKDEQFSRSNSTIDQLKLQMSQLEKQLKHTETELSTRTQQLTDVMKELQNCKSILGTITQLTSSQYLK